MKIFPDFEMKVTPRILPGTTNDGLEIDIQTYVRKKIKNKWYKVLVRSNYLLNYNTGILFADRRYDSELINDFYRRCYEIQVSKKYDTNKPIPDNTAMEMHYFELDTDQRSEEDRLNNVIRYNKIKFV